MSEHIKLLNQLGHLPIYDDQMTFDDEIVRSAVRSYQEMFAEELDVFTQRDHRRPSVADGDYGPSTESLLNLPRCGEPDILPATEDGSLPAIPERCRNEITTSYKPGMQLRGLTDEEWKEVWLASNQNLMDAVECTLTFDPDAYPETVFYAFPARLGGSVLADHILGNSCGAHRGRYDSDRTWNYGLAVAVASHEKTHGLGVGHTNASGALMNPFIHQGSIASRGKLTEADIKMLLRVGYKRRTGAPPTPPPDPSGEFITGEIKVHRDGSAQTFLISGRSV